jgi:hypothetical protein
MEDISVELQRENEKLRLEVSKFKMECLRLKDQVSSLSNREEYLQAQLENAVRQQQKLLHFDRSAEGQGQRELLEEQNGELRAALGAKEQEITKLQVQVRELRGRVVGFEEALLRGRPTAPASLSGKGTLARRWHDKLCVALSSCHFILKCLNAAVHIQTQPHFDETVEDADEDHGVDAVCRWTREECEKRCVSVAACGNAELPSEVAARGYQKHEDRLGAEVLGMIEQMETTIVRFAAHRMGEWPVPPKDMFSPNARNENRVKTNNTQQQSTILLSAADAHAQRLGAGQASTPETNLPVNGANTPSEEAGEAPSETAKAKAATPSLPLRQEGSVATPTLRVERRVSNSQKPLNRQVRVPPAGQQQSQDEQCAQQ